jgi:hypothetical protein
MMLCDKILNRPTSAKNYLPRFTIETKVEIMKIFQSKNRRLCAYLENMNGVFALKIPIYTYVITK